MGNVSPGTGMRLYGDRNERLYVNLAERERFIRAATLAPPKVRTFGLTLLYTGCRISEALELTPTAIQLEARTVSIRCLKKRHRHIVREVPIPAVFAALLDAIHEVGGVQAAPVRHAPLWCQHGHAISRATAYRWIKEIMAAAGIVGSQACPKGLRHGYGIHAIRSGVPLNMLCKWMGHASLATTAIYTNAIGNEEHEIAMRMW